MIDWGAVGFTAIFVFAIAFGIAGMGLLAGYILKKLRINGRY